jgi:excisionase family DNA binding protein
MTESSVQRQDLLTPAEVAAMFGVDTKTVIRWEQAGKLTAIRTLGGHRRFFASEIRRVLAVMPRQTTDEPSRS